MKGTNHIEGVLIFLHRVCKVINVVWLLCITVMFVGEMLLDFKDTLCFVLDKTTSIF